MIWDLFLFVLLWSVLWFGVSSILSRNDIADVAWGLFPIAFSIGIFIVQPPQYYPWHVLVFCIVVWGIRLAWHIGKRFFSHTTEDKRYAAWRNQWQYFRLRSYFQIFLLQSILAGVMALPIIFSTQQVSFGFIHWIGFFLFIIGMVFESVADAQLADFIRQKKNGETSVSIYQEGLWKYSRHPNYFGEVMLWWGLFLMTVSSEYWMYTILSPLTITILITKVSGIPMSEKHYEGNKEWEAYAQKTSIFFPLPPKL